MDLNQKFRLYGHEVLPVLPKRLRSAVLQQLHDHPAAGHFRVTQTHDSGQSDLFFVKFISLCRALYYSLNFVSIS